MLPGNYTIVTKLLFVKKKGQKLNILLKEDVHGNRAKNDLLECEVKPSPF